MRYVLLDVGCPLRNAHCEMQSVPNDLRGHFQVVRFVAQSEECRNAQISCLLLPMVSGGRVGVKRRKAKNNEEHEREKKCADLKQIGSLHCFSF